MRLFAPRTGHRRPISVTATAATALNRALFAFACISHGSSSCRGTGSGMAAKRWQKTADLEPAPPNVRHLHGKSLFCARHISRWQTYVFFTFPCRFSPVFPASRFSSCPNSVCNATIVLHINGFRVCIRLHLVGSGGSDSGGGAAAVIIASHARSLIA